MEINEQERNSLELNYQFSCEERRRLEIENNRIRKAYEAMKSSRDEMDILWRKSEDQNQELRGAITQLYYKCDLTRVPQSWIKAIERLLKKD